MFKDILEVFGKVKSRPLLVVFGALAMSTFLAGGGPIVDPFSAESFALPVFVFFADVMVIAWILFVQNINGRLSENDHANWGRVLGGTILAFCLCVTFWYVSNFPDPISLKLFGSSGFIRLFMLYLFAIETINIDRR
ncbi:hypothetical protein ACIPI6_23975 [Pseudomonas protegens]|uniref:hypothetical protein n=1 Tax=Pseudomonas protegens TaxID=380021 RepID=UPI003827574B